MRFHSFMRYAFSPEWTQKTHEVARKCEMNYLALERISCIVSQGSQSRRTIARIHSIGKAMQTGMRTPPYYVIELISERFFRQSEEERIKTLIHELLHIPRAFGGGFNGHRHHANHQNVDKLYTERVIGNKINQQ